MEEIFNSEDNIKLADEAVLYKLYELNFSQLVNILRSITIKNDTVFYDSTVVDAIWNRICEITYRIDSRELLELMVKLIKKCNVIIKII